MANIRLVTTSKQDKQRKKLYNATGVVKSVIDTKALEIGLNQMIADLESSDYKDKK